MDRSARLLAIAVTTLLLVATACGGGSSGEDDTVTLRLGYFPNLTHAPALYGIGEGMFADALGDDVEIETRTFNAGPEVVTALFAGDLDISYIGPNPAVNAFQRSKGEAVRIIAGATSGGAALVTKPELTSAADLRGKKIATPQLGNTQDVALRAWLDDSGLDTDQQGGGDVSILPQENAQTLDTFRSGEIDGAWVPEPWATRLVQEGGGRILVDEATLWPNGDYATTIVVARADFLDEHPGVVKSFLEGHVAALNGINADATAAQTVVNAQIEELTTKALPQEVLTAAWERLDFVPDPLVETIERSATAAMNVGLLDDDDIEGIEDLTLLNQVLRAAGKESVPG